jgi:cytochrome c5
MLGIVAPASDVLFAVPNHAPQTDKEWATVQNSALTLAEAGNLLMMPGRTKDNGDWMKYAKALVDTGSAAFQAANAKDAKALGDIGDKIDDTCETCHAKYLPKPPQ